MFGFRPRSRRTASRPAPSIEDVRAASAWGLTPHEWAALTDKQRSEYRANITAAPRFIP